MKKLWLLWMMALLPYLLCAQDRKAEEVLDQTFTKLSESNGIRVDFEGTENGFLLLKGEKFYLNNGSIQSWYDGKTQWSYVADTEEVNISHPTPEELQSINPHLILMRFKTDYDYTYKGTQTRKDVKVHEIFLTPKHSDNRVVINVFISQNHQPLAIKMVKDGRTLSEINVIDYQTNQKLDDAIFRFNKSLYPNAEVIDMR